MGRDGKSFRSKDRVLGETRATCGADPFSNRSVHHRSRFRSYRAMDETTRLGGGGLLQLAGGGYFNIAGSGHWATRLEIPTRGTETKGHAVIALRSGVCFIAVDLARVVGAFPHATTVSVPAKVPLCDRTPGRRSRRFDRTLGRVSERC